MAVLTGQSFCILKSQYTGEGPEQGFQCCFANGLNQKLISVCGAGICKDAIRKFFFKPSLQMTVNIYTFYIQTGLVLYISEYEENIPVKYFILEN